MWPVRLLQLQAEDFLLFDVQKRRKHGQDEDAVRLQAFVSGTAYCQSTTSAGYPCTTQLTWFRLYCLVLFPGTAVDERRPTLDADRRVNTELRRSNGPILGEANQSQFSGQIPVAATQSPRRAGRQQHRRHGAIVTRMLGRVFFMVL